VGVKNVTGILHRGSESIAFMKARAGTPGTVTSKAALAVVEDVHFTICSLIQFLTYFTYLLYTEGEGLASRPCLDDVE